jgi:hypothetical protein
MLSQNMDLSPDRPIGSRGTTRGVSNKGKVLSRNLSTTSVGKVSTKLKDKDSLFNLTKTKTEIAIQTDGESEGNLNFLKTRVKTVKIDESDGESIKIIVDHDKFKDDWVASLVYKRAMKSEAIQRGDHVDSDYEIDDEDEGAALTNTNFDASTTMGLERDPTANMELDFDSQF